MKYIKESRAKEEKICPMLKPFVDTHYGLKSMLRKCMGSKCMWWITGETGIYGNCSISIIADKIDQIQDLILKK